MTRVLVEMQASEFRTAQSFFVLLGDGLGVGLGFGAGLSACFSPFREELAISPDRVCFSGILAMSSVYDEKMSQSNLQTLSALPDDVLCEVVREAERRLDAQLATANAADQRAMSWAALLVTGAVAVTGGSAALLSTGQNLALSSVGICVAGVLGVSIWYAIMAVRPKDWHFPGNQPANWVPDQWQCYGASKPCDLRQAALEQAATMDEQIVDNAETARQAGADLKWSMDLALIAVVLGVIAVGLLLLAQVISSEVGVSGVHAGTQDAAPEPTQQLPG